MRNGGRSVPVPSTETPLTVSSRTVSGSLPASMRTPDSRRPFDIDERQAERHLTSVGRRRQLRRQESRAVVAHQGARNAWRDREPRNRCKSAQPEWRLRRLGVVMRSDDGEHDQSDHHRGDTKIADRQRVLSSVSPGATPVAHLLHGFVLAFGSGCHVRNRVVAELGQHGQRQRVEAGHPDPHSRSGITGEEDEERVEHLVQIHGCPTNRPQRMPGRGSHARCCPRSHRSTTAR